jgi:hypothetical protein
MPTFAEGCDALDAIDSTIPDPNNRMNTAGYTDAHITEYFRQIVYDVHCFPVSFLHPGNFAVMNGRRIIFN